MNEGSFLPASRSIRAIKVDATPVGQEPARLRIEWTDGSGTRQHYEQAGKAASEIITDLHACTLVSEGTRLGYLIGAIRIHSLRSLKFTEGGG